MLNVVVLIRATGANLEIDLQAMKWIRYMKTIMELNVVGISMGDKVENEVIQTMFRLGLSKFYLLKDSAFIGSDTYGTAKVLVSGIEEIVPDFDLIFTNCISVYGETGHVPAEVAAMLNIPYAINVKDIIFEGTGIRCIQEFDNYAEIVKIKYPCLVSIDSTHMPSEIKRLSLFDLDIKMEENICVLNAYNIGISEKAYIGNNSYTSVIESKFKKFERENLLNVNVNDETILKFLEVIENLKY